MAEDAMARALAQVDSLVHAKRPVRGTLVVVLSTHRQDRGLRARRVCRVSRGLRVRLERRVRYFLWAQVTRSNQLSGISLTRH